MSRLGHVRLYISEMEIACIIIITYPLTIFAGAHSTRSVHVASPARYQYLQLYYHLHTNRRRCYQESETPVRVALKGPFKGPALTFWSFNGEGLSAAKQQLIADLRHRLQCAVVCMQEIHRGPDDIRPSIPEMDLAIERPHTQYGSAIFVTSGTIVNTTSLTDINNIEILRVDLNGILVTSVYKPPGERFSFHQPLTAVGDQQQVIIGDFDSHSSTWGYASYQRENRTFPATIQPEEGKLGAVRISARCSRGEHPRHRRML